MFNKNAYSSSMVIGASTLGDMARLEFSVADINENIEIKQQGTEILINFNNPIYTNPLILTELAPGYVIDARLSKDLTTIIITTTQKYKINNLILNNTLFLELIGLPSTNLKDLKEASDRGLAAYFPPLVDKNQEINDLPSVPADIHEKIVLDVFSDNEKYDIASDLDLDIANDNNQTTYDFTWDKKIPFKVKKTGQELNIAFKADVLIEDTDVASLLPSNMKKFKSISTKNRLDVFIPIPKNYVYKVSDNENKVLVKVSPKPRPKAKIAAKKSVKPKKSASIKKEIVVKKDIKKEKTEQKAIAKPEIKEINKTPIQDKIVSKKETEVKQNISDDSKKIESKKEEPYVEPVPTAMVKKEILKENPIPAEKEVEDVIFVEPPVKVIEEDDNSRTFSLSFPWSRDTAAALFKKHGYWWIVFDRKAEVDFSLLKRLGGDVVHEIVQLEDREATIVRMIIDKGYNPTVRKEGLLWIMDIVARQTSPTINLEIEPRVDDNEGASLFISTNRVGVMQELVDPLYGDAFTVVPVYGLGWGIPKTRSFPGVVLSQTIQGVVVEPLSSGIVVKTNDSGIEITEVPNGLSLSSDAIISIEEEVLLTMEGLDKLFDLSAFERETEDDVQKDLPNFLARAAQAKTQDQKNIQRLNLARFYLANNYIPETFAVLRTLAHDDYDVSQTPAFLAIQGMANVIFKRPDDAMDSLNREIFEASDMAKVWLAAAYAEKNDFSEAQFNVLKKYINAIRILPYDIKVDLAILGAKTAYDQDDEATMDTFLEMIIPEKNNPYQQAAFDYYKGMYHNYLSSFKDAEDYFTKAYESPAQLYHALAGKELAKLQFMLDMISVEELAKKLERLRYAWRGDNIEYDTMSDLVDIYLENEKYPEALRKMNEIIKDFPNHRRTPAIKAKSSELFRQLYADDKSESMDPVVAIALFKEFENLLPKNTQGYDMVKKLADRLVSVDLLDNAAVLLEKQLQDINVQGEQRSAIGTRLALIYLLDKRPAKALDALEMSVYFPISGELDEQRTLIQAKAMANIGLLDEAIEILNIQNTENARKLAVELYWVAKDWEGVSDAIKPLIKKPQIGKPVSQEQIQLLLAWASAMRLAGNETGLARLRENFITYMKNTPYFDAFKIITSTDENEMDVKNVAREIEDVQNFSSFLTNYTKDLKANSLSEVVK